MVLWGFAAAFAAGALAKLTDIQVDEKRFLAKNFKYLTGAAYGILFAVLLLYGREFASLFLGIAAAVLLAGKIDSKAHQVAVAFFLMTIPFLSFPSFEPAVVLLVAAFGFLDEVVNDYFDASKSKGIAKKIFGYRIMLELVAFGLSVYFSNWKYFLAIVSFDAGFILVGKLSRKIGRSVPGSFGTHLVLDLRDCPSKKLENEQFVRDFLKELPKEIGMKPISKPVVKRIKTKFDEGISGFVMLSESHVSIHTFPKFHSAHLDVFSCKPFDVEEVKKNIEKRFSAKYSNASVLSRMGE
ncbi:S-adenosylmethionine decarboxylase [Candidatus Micrarchaeota archaeon]|nr:S-adenosylmethionine decarboxylase [Candidatus Micrarchaeota archaeon]